MGVSCPAPQSAEISPLQWRILRAVQGADGSRVEGSRERDESRKPEQGSNMSKSQEERQ